MNAPTPKDDLATVTLSPARLDAMAQLQDEPHTVTLLQRARLSRNLAFLATVTGGLGTDPPGHLARVGFELLAAVQHHQRQTANEMLQHPRFGAWVAVCAADHRNRSTAGTTSPAAIHLASFAAAAALRAQFAFDMELPQIADTVVVPGMGCWTGPIANTTRVRYDGHTVPMLTGRRWRALRLLTFEHLPVTGRDGIETNTVEFDDLPATPSVRTRNPTTVSWRPWSDRDVHTWRRRFAAALRLLDEAVPELAQPLRRGFRSVSPQPASCRFVSSTLADSFGSATMILPADTTAMAAALVHEFQHSKLSALMDLIPLISREEPADLPSPWRPEPRPSSAILHGIYAHAAIARFGRRLEDLGNGSRIPEIRRIREESLTACDTLLRTNRLTRAGRRFVELLHDTATGDLARAAPANRERT